MESRQSEFNELRRRAIILLECADRIEPRRPIRNLLAEFRLWHYPSFSAYRSWTAFTPMPRSQNSQCMAREVTWDFPADDARLADPLEGLKQGFHTDPTVVVRDGELPDHEFSVLIEQGRRLNIPLIGIEQNCGLDGETSGIELFDFDRVRLE
ncbi:MAG TPA: hypothetical protein VIC84_11715, partial [Blastocatellia bacterium]